MAKKGKQKKRKMPRRIWSANLDGFNWQQKHFLSFIWACSPKGCHCWNCRLAKHYHVTTRTVQRWISNLKHHELIAIGFPDGPGRTIWPRYQALATPVKPLKSEHPITAEAQARFLKQLADSKKPKPELDPKKKRAIEENLKRRRAKIAETYGPPPKWDPTKTNQA